MATYCGVEELPLLTAAGEGNGTIVWVVFRPFLRR